MNDLDMRLLRFRNRRGDESGSQLAVDLLAADRIDEVLEVISAAAERGAPKLPLSMLEGRVWLQRGDLVRAQASLIQAAQLATDDPEPFEALGEVLLKRGDPQRAMAVLQRALQLGSRKPETLAAFENARRTLPQEASPPPEAAVAVPSTAESPPLQDGQGTVSYQDPGPKPARRSPTAIPGLLARGIPPPSPPPPRPSSLPRSVKATLRFDPAHFEGANPTMVSTPPFEGVHESQTISQEFEYDREALTTTLTEIAAESHEMTATWARPEAAHPEVALPAAAADEAASRDSHEPVLPADPSVDFVVAVPEAVPEASPRLSPPPHRSVPPPLRSVLTSRLPPPPHRISLATHAPGRRTPRRQGRSSVFKFFTVTLLMAGIGLSGYAGFRFWQLRQQPQLARKLVRQAAQAALLQDPLAWRGAERRLQRAQALQPEDRRIADLRMRLRAQRLLEEGNFAPSFVKQRLAEVAAGGLSTESQQWVRALNAAAVDDTARLAAALATLAPQSSSDAWLLYLAGRLAQRGELDAAAGWLEWAQGRPQPPLSAALALAALASEQGRWRDAARWVQAALQRQPASVRARLWQSFIAAHLGEQESKEALTALASLRSSTKRAAAAGDILFHLAEARWLHRLERQAECRAAMRRAFSAAAEDSIWSIMLAHEALDLGLSGIAEQAVARARQALPQRQSLILLLSRIQLQRGAPALALATLAAVTEWRGEVLEQGVRATLALHTPQAIKALQKRLAETLRQATDEGVKKEVQGWQLLTLARAAPTTEGLVEQARSLAEENPSSPAALEAWSEMAFQRGTPWQARAAAERLQRLAPQSTAGDLAVARAATRAGNFDAAEAALRNAMRKAPSDAESKLAVGALRMAQGLYESALSWYDTLRTDEVVAQNSAGWLRMQLARVRVLIDLHRSSEARALFETLAAERREAPSGRQIEAELALAEGQAERALEILKPLVGSSDADALQVATYGRALLASSKPDPASAQFARALEMQAELPEALLGMADYFISQSMPPAALSMLERAQRVCNKRGCTSRMTAQILLATGKAHLQRRRKYRSLALETLHQAIEIRGAPAEAWFVLGQALIGDKPVQSREALRTYLKLAPTGADAAKAKQLLGAP